ncbi:MULTISPECIES: 1-acyl-sn-glycerol-3-phosphate acyltransferase [Kosmotoga]|uniref:1-acyl-sn-glycerol-3-phosphate acyltransferase n=1 Tax=Kosmotoga olearia (strain ATCC BAA-1733 / DSM 21960 / TBF 19.5.1) TaxID=521045 RepID=C5CE33_KOSOT|nr:MULTISPECIES: lysophospholipid acyltransferase family protein [Kosmotoga]ACR80135.1 1-acyl-sn-glycerol-3-phosphate acyltransferase [Kosmotoga olearia TBF 19.5.1]MDI3523730.1 1-acyl-sn-glycerol-3-phosphate acyltransferase [Kosmotoga sp.]MDK2953210.1 1-acyl-sn-glycerol-3-phosphate acyltransferase [Kosmotoga sp.]
MKSREWIKQIRDFFLTIWVAIAVTGYVLVYGAFVLLISWFIEKFRGIEAAKDYVAQEVGRFGRVAFFVIGSKVSVEGAENIPPKGPLVIVSNHQSAFDIPLIVGYVKGRISFIAKIEVSKIPGFSWFVKRLDGVFIDRGNKIQTAAAIKRIFNILRNGGTIMLFPEGTRSLDGSIKKFKKGSLSIPHKLNIPILPVAIDGTKDIMKKGELLIHPAIVKIRILKPVYPGKFNTEDELREEIRKMISEAIVQMRNRGEEYASN